jgi:hypothetical protein
MRGSGADESSKSLESERIGGRGRDRTGDPLLAKQVLSQLSYTPTVGATFILNHFSRFQNPFPHSVPWNERLASRGKRETLRISGEKGEFVVFLPANYVRFRLSHSSHTQPIYSDLFRIVL